MGPQDAYIRASRFLALYHFKTALHPDDERPMSLLIKNMWRALDEQGKSALSAERAGEGSSDRQKSRPPSQLLFTFFIIHKYSYYSQIQLLFTFFIIHIGGPGHPRVL